MFSSQSHEADGLAKFSSKAKDNLFVAFHGKLSSQERLSITFKGNACNDRLVFPENFQHFYNIRLVLQNRIGKLLIFVAVLTCALSKTEHPFLRFEP